jgi:hypothetical protein
MSFFPETEDRKVKQILSGEGGDYKKGCRRVNMVEIICARVVNGKNETC